MNALHFFIYLFVYLRMNASFILLKTCTKFCRVSLKKFILNPTYVLKTSCTKRGNRVSFQWKFRTYSWLHVLGFLSIVCSVYVLDAYTQIKPVESLQLHFFVCVFCLKDSCLIEWTSFKHCFASVCERNAL